MWNEFIKRIWKKIFMQAFYNTKSSLVTWHSAKQRLNRELIIHHPASPLKFVLWLSFFRLYKWNTILVRVYHFSFISLKLPSSPIPTPQNHWNALVLLRLKRISMTTKGNYSLENKSIFIVQFLTSWDLKFF